MYGTFKTVNTNKFIKLYILSNILFKTHPGFKAYKTLARPMMKYGMKFGPYVNRMK
jgi:hypothetical protein